MTKILVIEDEKALLDNIVELLELEDFEATGVENGLVGVQLALQIAPDLIICDILMPELDGYGVLTSLRTDPITANIPFIFMTAQTDRVDVPQGMDLRVDNYVTKPFTATQLLRAIATQLEKQADHKRKQG